jgi:hypothetical protein
MKYKVILVNEYSVPSLENRINDLAGIGFYVSHSVETRHGPILIMETMETIKP